MDYGIIKNNQLRRFISQTLCEKCGDRMVESKREKGKFACRKHPQDFRMSEDIVAERKLFELIRTLLNNLNIRGIMIHHLDHDTLGRGELIDRYETDLLSNPTYSLPVGLIISYQLIKLSKDPSEFVKILPGNTGALGYHWRIVNPHIDADLLTLISRAVKKIDEGIVINDIVIEAIKDKEDSDYVEKLDILNNQKDVLEEAEEDKINEVIAKYKRSMPRYF